MSGAIDPWLLSILVCPATRTPLRYDEARQELVSEEAGLAYPIRDGVPDLPSPRRPREASWDRSRAACRSLHRARGRRSRHANRSEEHTSELQSLMRSSYAVFCLKKTKKKIT